jgi:hypothetical protein
MPYVPCLVGYWRIKTVAQEDYYVLNDTEGNRDYAYDRSPELVPNWECCSLWGEIGREFLQSCQLKRVYTKQNPLQETHQFAIPVRLRYSKPILQQTEWVECGYYIGNQTYSRRIQVLTNSSNETSAEKNDRPASQTTVFPNCQPEISPNIVGMLIAYAIGVVLTY